MVKTDENPLWPQLDVEEHGLKMCHICPELATTTEGTCLNHNISRHSVTGNQCRVIYPVESQCLM